MSIENTVENVYLRHNAVQLTRKHFWRLLGMSIILFLVTGSLEYLFTRLGELLSVQVGSVTAETLVAATNPAPLSLRAFVFNLVYMVVSSLIVGGLYLGYVAQFISAGRGNVPKVFGVFKRMRYCLKGWGLSLLIGLKTLLWMLPGLVLLFMGAEMQIYGNSGFANWVLLAGIVLMFGLVIPAALRYSLAYSIMADEPDRGIRDCITLSKGLMKDRKWQYFKLGMPMVLKIIGVFYAASLVSSLVLVSISTVSSPAAPLIVLAIMLLVIAVPISYFELQMSMVYALFYLKRRETNPDAPVSYWLRDHSKDDPAQAAPVSYWLREHTATEIEPADQETSEAPEAPAGSIVDSAEDIAPETNEEKENPYE